MRTSARLGFALGCGVGLGLGALAERDARACGGCIQPVQKVDSTLTAERMIFSISKTQTTLYDQINFSGAPSSFAWVLPIKGTVTVGLSADIFFDTIDQLTATAVYAPALPCSFGFEGGGFGGGDSGSGGGDGGGGGVTVIAHEQVGPYETVQLASKDGSALSSWLKSNGYEVPPADAPVIADYVAAGMNFLAMKLVPGVGVQSMQPVRVTTQGAFPVLPLHMVSVGTGAITGITLWIVAEGRWEPTNAPFFTIADSDLTWDWTTGSSDYEEVRLAKEKALGNAGWQIESSLELAKTTVSDAVLQNVQYGGVAGDGGGGAVGEAGVGGYLPPPDGGVEGGMSAAADDDLAMLFAGISGANARITRLRTDIAHAALSKDLVVGASKDSRELSNIVTPTNQIHTGCPADGGEGSDGGDAGAAGTSGGAGCNTTAPGSLDPEDVGAMGLALVLGAQAYRRRKKSSGR